MPMGGKVKNKPVEVKADKVKFRIETKSGRVFEVEREGKAFGPLVVHTYFEVEQGTSIIVEKETPAWSVSSLTTGRFIAGFKTIEDADRMAEALVDNCWLALSQPRADKVVALLDPWMMQWINTARQKKVYLDPEPFREMQREQRRKV